MDVTFITGNEKFTTKITNEKSYICKLLAEEPIENQNEFNVDLAFSKTVEDDANKENVLYALKYLHTNNSIYKTIRGLEFLGILEENLNVLNGLRGIKFCENESFSPYISSVIMNYFGEYETLMMISEGLKLNYEGKLTVANYKITQNLLDRCSQCLTITHLIACNNPNVNSVAFCAETLKILNAHNSGIDQNGIKNCTKLKKLAASDNPKITNVDFCAKTLEELDASYDCGIDQESIEKCTKLKKLNYKYNKKITKFPL